LVAARRDAAHAFFGGFHFQYKQGTEFLTTNHTKYANPESFRGRSCIPRITWLNLLKSFPLNQLHHERPRLQKYFKIILRFFKYLCYYISLMNCARQLYRKIEILKPPPPTLQNYECPQW
jgi:hypothetical protein